MDLWSKGLGRLVLQIRLSERSEMVPQKERLAMRGTMGAPTFWDYAVNLQEDDVLDFVHLLKQPAPVRFLTGGSKRAVILRTALSGAILFAWYSLRRFLGAGPSLPTGTQEKNG